MEVEVEVISNFGYSSEFGSRVEVMLQVGNCI